MPKFTIELSDPYWAKLQALAAWRKRSPAECIQDWLGAAQTGPSGWEPPSDVPKKKTPPAKVAKLDAPFPITPVESTDDRLPAAPLASVGKDPDPHLLTSEQTGKPPRKTRSKHEVDR